MTTLIIFLLASTGLTLIVTKSLLFKPVRAYVTEKYVDAENENKKSVLIWHFWDNILNCPMCFSVYGGSICSLIVYLSTIYPYLIWILYPFCATPVVTLIIQYYSKENRQ